MCVAFVLMDKKRKLKKSYWALWNYVCIYLLMSDRQNNQIREKWDSRIVDVVSFSLCSKIGRSQSNAQLQCDMTSAQVWTLHETGLPVVLHRFQPDKVGCKLFGNDASPGVSSQYMTICLVIKTAVILSTFIWLVITSYRWAEGWFRVWE